MKKTLLWLLALVLMLAAVVYQRTTGPTYPIRGEFEAAGETHQYRLLRSEETSRQARIALPHPAGATLEAQLHYKRFRTADSLTVTPFVKESEEWAAYLPVQPAAGKMSYFITLTVDGNRMRIPAAPGENIVLRYKDPVPAAVLLPHIILMFFSVLIGMRAALSALFNTGDMRKWAFVTLVGMTIGGMILGPIVQKYAFGEYWTGFPFGGDLTDNKTLIMWMSWVIAVVVLTVKMTRKEVLRRAVVVAAAIVMTAVYLIPHSMGGSELDYGKVDEGIHPSEAIGTGE